MSKNRIKEKSETTIEKEINNFLYEITNYQQNRVSFQRGKKQTDFFNLIIQKQSIMSLISGNSVSKKPIYIIFLMQKINTFCQSVTQSPHVRNLVSELKLACQGVNNLSALEFYKTEQYSFIKEKIFKTKVGNPEEFWKELPKFSKILAMRIEANDKFTLYMIIIPKGKSFTWHDHPDMNGFIKCLEGQIKIRQISSLDFEEEKEKFVYPKNLMKQDILNSEENSLSWIDPQMFNTHQIVGVEQAAFFDIMLPEYPKKNGQSYKVISETEDEMEFEKLPQTYSEDIYFLKSCST